ncbi:MAG: alpha/beta hydrolase [Candidatus Thiodiazotropha sp.]
MRTLRLMLWILSRLSPGLAGAWALRLFTTPPRFPMNPQETSLHDRTHPEMQMIAGRKIAVRPWGNGPTVLFSHGWGGQGVHFHALIECLVNAGYQAVCFDAPAHGDSPGKRTQLLEISSVLARLAQSLGPIHALVGHSFGCATALLAMSRRELTVERVILFACFDDIEWITGRFATIFGLNETVRRAMMEQAHRRYPTHAGEAWEWQQLSPLSSIRRFDGSLLLVHDRDDREVPYEHALKLSETQPRAKLLTTRGLGHKRILSDPDTVQDCIAFIRRDV